METVELDGYPNSKERSNMSTKISTQPRATAPSQHHRQASVAVSMGGGSSPAQTQTHQQQQHAATQFGSGGPAPPVPPGDTRQQPRPPPPPQQQQQAAAVPPSSVPSEPPLQQQPPLQPRFEDLTIDDDLPLLPRLQRYVRSSIALQRLVHVRMLGEAALEVGQQLTATELVPLLPPLVRDGESIIRQRLCAELRALCLVLMGMTGDARTEDRPDEKTQRTIPAAMPQIPKPNKSSKYYKVMVHHLFPHLFTLISDPDNEVRRAASENIVKLALRVDESDVVTLALSIPLRLVKEGQKRAQGSTPNDAASNNDSNNNGVGAGAAANPQTPAEDLLITSSNLLADLASFLPPPRLPPDVTTRYLSPTILSLAEDPNFRVRRAAVQALPRALGSATLDDVKRRLLPRFVALSSDEMYRVRKASGECLVDVSRALGVLPWRIHFGDVWIDCDGKNRNKGENGHVDTDTGEFYRARTKKQINDLHNTIRECHEIRRRALCAIAKKLLEDTNKFVRYGMMQFLGPLIASFYPLDRGSMVGAMGGLLFGAVVDSSLSGGGNGVGTLGMGAGSVGIAKGSTGLERIATGSHNNMSDCRVEDVLSFNHSLHGLELILHGESPANNAVLSLGGGCDANKDPFGTMGPQFFPHANGMVGRSSALDDDDTDAFLLGANYSRRRQGGGFQHNIGSVDLSTASPRALLPKFILESRSDALALARIVCHRSGCIPTATNVNDFGPDGIVLSYPPLMSGRPDPEDLKAISSSLLAPYIAMASCRTGEDTTDAEMRVYCAYSLPAVVLLFGSPNWEREGLKGCFLDLLGGDPMEGDAGGAVGDSTAAVAPGSAPQQTSPLPVKRCLASSVHAVARMLGPEVASRDPSFLAAFDRCFLHDPDEAIRLNILRNLASFLGALPPGDGPGRREGYLPAVSAVVMGEDVLGATRKRSASNPGVLNWRQRNAVARVLPDLMVLFEAGPCREHLWPVLKTLLTDSVSAVREDAGWSVPVLLRIYFAADIRQRRPSGRGASMESGAWTSEVTTWLRETFLEEGGCGDAGNGSISGRPSRMTQSRRLSKKQMTSFEGAFSKRQGYCRVLSAVALAARMGEGEGDADVDGFNPEGSSLNDGRGGGVAHVPIDPFSTMTPHERERFWSILLLDLLPPALEMAADCVANVRLTLTRCLKSLPADIRREGRVEEVLGTLEEELLTWDVGDLPLGDGGPGGILGNGVGAGFSSSDPPEAKGSAGGAGNAQGSGVILMTSTMSSC